MSATAVLFALLCAWLVIGIVSCFVMTRRGHDPWSWGVLGALLGPLVIPLALAAIRREPEKSTVVASWHAGQVGRGPISVLVGVDGSVEAEAAACTVVELFGSRLGHLTLGTVIPTRSCSQENQQTPCSSTRGITTSIYSRSAPAGAVSAKRCSEVCPADSCSNGKCRSSSSDRQTSTPCLAPAARPCRKTARWASVDRTG